MSLFQNLGGEPSDEMYRPEEGIPQITLLAYDSFVEYVPKKLQPRYHYIGMPRYREVCFVIHVEYKYLHVSEALETFYNHQFYKR